MSGTVRVEHADLRVGADRPADAGRRCGCIHLDALPRDTDTFGSDVLATAVRAFASEADECTATGLGRLSAHLPEVAR